MNLVIRNTLGALLLLEAISVYAGTGNLFNVTTTGGPLTKTVNYTLCLTINGQKPLSCQNYSTSKATLLIKTTAPNHTYHYAGIKINTPGFTYIAQGIRASSRAQLTAETMAAGYTPIGIVSDTRGAIGTLSSGTALSVSVTDLALSISGLTLNGQPSGQPRTITITNASESEVRGLAIEYPTWPDDTSASSDCGVTMAPGAWCTITVTPGSTPSTNCSTTGIEPTPGVITVRASNATGVTVNVVVLNYGCIYQGGYLFAMNETADMAESIGGTVVTQSDQAPGGSNGIVWSSNGTGSNSSNVSFDSIPGIVRNSTTASPLPTYSDAQTSFNSQYNNFNLFPFPPQELFSACNGRIDGACNSANILVLYNAYKTNFGIDDLLAVGPTDPAYYAAGRCTAIISGYSDWYLPAICEMGPNMVGSGCSLSTQNMVTNLPNLLGAADTSGALITSCNWGNGGLHSTNCLAGRYWSSSENGGDPKMRVFSQTFAPSNGSGQIPDTSKSNQIGVRCTRSF
jgi:hypothetical protein